MSNAKPTPGPWKLLYTNTPRRRPNSPLIHVDTAQGIVATVYCDDDANARLISSAPDLLEACKAAHEELQPCASKDCYEHGHPYCAFGLTKAAIARAEGAS